MITLRLSIRRTKQQHAVAAWLLPGGDPAEWLAELIQRGVSLETLRLFLLPTSRDDRTVSRVLVVPQVNRVSAASSSFNGAANSGPGDQSGPSRFHEFAKPTTIPYRLFGDRLYLPVDATLHPQIEARELASFFSSEVVAYVFHPTIGLVGIDEGSVLRVRDLLSLPTSVAKEWDAARPGLKINERLISIELTDPPSVTTILEEAKDDIGSQASSLSQLPPGPREPGDGPMSKLARGFASGVAKATLWLTSFSPPTATKPTWINSLQSWARSKLAGVGQAIESIRNKEIRRLLDLLENNPDEGLRYAPPLDGPAHRGTASPTNYLANRPVDFSLSRLGGGLAGDYWHLQRQYYERLRQNYRRLAAREIKLGRHRRAAYIYAELLNDLNAAASTLKDGGHHREAAVLYRDRLNRPLEAANCLTDGGLFGEAISLFEELNEYERAGDLHRRLDQPEEARDAYWRAADAHATAGDLLSAARILEDKMALPDRAVEALQAGWPDSHQSQRCLQSLFELLARLGRHNDARERLLALRDEPYTAKQTQLVAATMAATATTYPSDEVRALAADSCRVVVGRSLSNAEMSLDRQLLQSIEQLSSEDRLLQRDCSRFGRQTVRPHIRRAAAPRPDRRAAPALVVQFALPRDVQWQTVVAANGLFYAAGYRGNALSVVRGNWSGSVQSPSGQLWLVHLSPITPRSRILLAPPMSDMRALWVHCKLVEHAPRRLFAASDQFPQSATASALPGEPDRVVAVARGALGVTWVFSMERDGPCLVAYGTNGMLIRSVPLSSMEADEWDWLSRISMHVTDEAIYVASGVRLLRVGTNGDQSTESFNAPIRSLTGTMPHTRIRLAVGFQQGGFVLWPNAGDEADAQAFGQDLHDFEMCFTKGGAFVAVSASGGEIYSTHEGRVELIATLPGCGETPLAVVPTSHLKRFAVCLPSGVVRVYQLP